MTRKQCLKRFDLNREDKAKFINVVKKYKGYLSYTRLFLLVYLSWAFGRKGIEEILSYVEAVIDSEIKGDRYE